MVNFKPGIPDSFSLDVEPVRDLGDYLDEPSPRPQGRPRPEASAMGEGRGTVGPAPAPLAPAAPVAAPIAASTDPTIDPREERTQRHVPHPQPPAVQATHEPTSNKDRASKEKAPRREISMTPETLRMSDELLEVIRNGSGQRDTKANELFHALVLLVHEVVAELDPHAIPKRGRWGTPTARAYPLELKNAFLQALLRKSGAASKEAIGSKFSVDDAA